MKYPTPEAVKATEQIDLAIDRISEALTVIGGWDTRETRDLYDVCDTLYDVARRIAGRDDETE